MISLTNSQIGELMGQFLLAGTGTLSFAILFACPRRSLPTCALVGAMGWFVYELCVMLGLGTAAASLLAVIPLTILTRVFAILQKTPVTVFLLSGIFPLVPGAGIYYTAYYFIQGDNALALSNGISTFKVAVALAVGISLVLSVVALNEIIGGVIDASAGHQRKDAAQQEHRHRRFEQDGKYPGEDGERDHCLLFHTGQQRAGPLQRHQYL